MVEIEAEGSERIMNFVGKMDVKIVTFLTHTKQPSISKGKIKEFDLKVFT